MSIHLMTTKIKANVLSQVEDIEKRYDLLPDITAYWCFIDLNDSANYRLSQGSKDGYVRGELFFLLVKEVITRCPEIRLIKEIGDAVFISSQEFRPILESFLLIDQISFEFRVFEEREKYPFSLKAGISYGPAKRLIRNHEDCLGSSTDATSRLMSACDEENNFVVDENVVSLNKQILDEYNSFLSMGSPKILPEQKSKGLLKQLIYRELKIDRKLFHVFSSCFSSWR